MDHYKVIKAMFFKDSSILREYIEHDRVYDFLVGLNEGYDQVRIQKYWEGKKFQDLMMKSWQLFGVKKVRI